MKLNYLEIIFSNINILCHQITDHACTTVFGDHGFTWHLRSDLVIVYYDLQVPVAGCYRLIDIPMSNCINSGINKIFVLTQFNSASLNRHIARTYFGNGINFGDGFVEVQKT